MATPPPARRSALVAALRRSPWGGAFLLAVCLAWPQIPARAEPPGTAPQTEEARARTALEGLSSPLRRERQAAARALIELLPGARGRVVEAWKAGDEGLRATLTDVLAADGSPELLSLALEAWRTGGDALAARARSALMTDPEATRKALTAFAARPPPPEPPERRSLQAIGHLLDRGEVEKLFLARKSRSGGTGFYQGQYEALRPHRALALEVCFHIVTDRAMRLPGTSSVGGYRFVRPPAQVLDVFEVRSMALNAILDLATRADADIMKRLDGYHAELAARDAGDSVDDGDPERKALMDDVLATLCRLDPATYRSRLEDRVWELENSRTWLEHREAAPVALRAGWYEKATQLYNEQLRGSMALAHDHYNLSCAFASWALEGQERLRATLLARALQHLEQAVVHGWTDIAWMEQDRDLDPIRDTPRYKELKARIETRIGGDQPLPEVPSGRRRR